jgi:hypothetical protein
VEAIAQVDSRQFDRIRSFLHKPKMKPSMANVLAPINGIIPNEAGPLVKRHCGQLVGSISQAKKLQSEPRCVNEGHPGHLKAIESQFGIREREARELPRGATSTTEYTNIDNARYQLGIAANIRTLPRDSPDENSPAIETNLLLPFEEGPLTLIVPPTTKVTLANEEQGSNGANQGLHPEQSPQPPCLRHPPLEIQQKPLVLLEYPNSVRTAIDMAPKGRFTSLLSSKSSSELYCAIGLDVDPRLAQQWRDLLRPWLNDKLQYEGAEDDVWGLELLMAGPEASTLSMKPTVIMRCSREGKKQFEKMLSKLIPKGLAFVTIVEDIVLSSGGLAPQTEHGYNSGAKVEAAFPDNAESLVGIKGRISADEASKSYYPPSTIGGVILVGDTFYAISTAHSLFREPSAAADEPQSVGERPGRLPNPTGSNASYSANFKILGTLHSVGWTGPRVRLETPPNTKTEKHFGADWALIKIPNMFLCPNIIQDPEHPAGAISINGHIADERNIGGDVWVCCGVGGIQRGYLNGNPATVVYGTAIFDVYSVIVERALGTE